LFAPSEADTLLHCGLAVPVEVGFVFEFEKDDGRGHHQCADAESLCEADGIEVAARMVAIVPAAVMSQSGRLAMRGAMRVAGGTPSLEYKWPYEDSWEP
jgi:hypothetical protein